MSLGIELTYPEPAKWPPLMRLQNGLKTTAVRREMGRAIATAVRKHLTLMDSEKANALGGARTHFYGNARKAVSQPELISGDGIKVTIDHLGLAQRYYGGTITARPGSALTIPVHPAAHGKRAREIADLQLIPTPRSAHAKAILAKPNKQSKNGIGEVYYVLCKRVTQDPDKSILPTDQELTNVAMQAGEKYIQILMERDNGH